MSCEDVLKFDVTAVTSDYASQYSVLSFVNQQNYEEMKQQFSASIPDYFSGSYDQFSKKRGELTHLFQEAGVTSLHKSYYTRTLSSAGAKAYAICMAQQSSKPVSAWIEAITDTKIVVGLRCGLAGSAKIAYECVGPQPDQKPVGELGANSQTALMFTYDPSVDFVVAFNVHDEKYDSQDMVVVELPKRRKFALKTRTVNVVGNVIAGAGGNGNTAGNPRSEDAELVAPPGYYLNPNTVRMVQSQVIGGPGLASYQMTWQSVSNEAGRIVKITAHPVGMNGADGDTQGINQLKVAVTAEQPYLEETIG